MKMAKMLSLKVYQFVLMQNSVGLSDKNSLSSASNAEKSQPNDKQTKGP